MCIGKSDRNTDAMTVTSSDKSLTCRIESCESYVYLGCIFTSDGNIKTAVKKHVEDKKKQLLKLVMFYAKNPDMPFSVKLKVMNACFLSSVLYSCESWIHVNISKNYIMEQLKHC
jgi:hypothetical protein